KAIQRKRPDSNQCQGRYNPFCTHAVYHFYSLTVCLYDTALTKTATLITNIAVKNDYLLSDHKMKGTTYVSSRTGADTATPLRI
ncbi:MAG: hypothetical protein AAFR67_09150, partial [Chloroflexota bacterium]